MVCWSHAGLSSVNDTNEEETWNKWNEPTDANDTCRRTTDEDFQWRQCYAYSLVSQWTTWSQLQTRWD